MENFKFMGSAVHVFRPNKPTFIKTNCLKNIVCKTVFHPLEIIGMFLFKSNIFLLSVRNLISYNYFALPYSIEQSKVSKVVRSRLSAGEIINIEGGYQ